MNEILGIQENLLRADLYAGENHHARRQALPALHLSATDAGIDFTHIQTLLTGQYQMGQLPAKSLRRNGEKFDLYDATFKLVMSVPKLNILSIGLHDKQIDIIDVHGNGYQLNYLTTLAAQNDFNEFGNIFDSVTGIVTLPDLVAGALKIEYGDNSISVFKQGVRKLKIFRNHIASINADQQIGLIIITDNDGRKHRLFYPNLQDSAQEILVLNRFMSGIYNLTGLSQGSIQDVSPKTFNLFAGSMLLGTFIKEKIVKESIYMEADPDLNIQRLKFSDTFGSQFTLEYDSENSVTMDNYHLQSMLGINFYLDNLYEGDLTLDYPANMFQVTVNNQVKLWMVKTMMYLASTPLRINNMIFIVDTEGKIYRLYYSSPEAATADFATLSKLATGEYPLSDLPLDSIIDIDPYQFEVRKGDTVLQLVTADISGATLVLPNTITFQDANGNHYVLRYAVDEHAKLDFLQLQGILGGDVYIDHLTEDLVGTSYAGNYFFVLGVALESPDRVHLDRAQIATRVLEGNRITLTTANGTTYRLDFDQQAHATAAFAELTELMVGTVTIPDLDLDSVETIPSLDNPRFTIIDSLGKLIYSIKKQNITAIAFDDTDGLVTLTDKWGKVYNMFYDSPWNAEKDYHRLNAFLFNKDVFVDEVQMGQLVLDYAGNRMLLVKEGKTLYTISKPHISSVSVPRLLGERVVITMVDGLVYRLYHTGNSVSTPAESAQINFGQLLILRQGVYTISVLQRNALYFVNPLTIAIRKAGEEVERLAIENIVSFDLSDKSIIIVDKNGNTHVLVYNTVDSATNDYNLYHTITDPQLGYEFYEHMGDNSIHKITDNRLEYRNTFGNTIVSVPIRDVLEVTREGNDIILVHNHARVIVLRYSSDYYALTAYNNTIEAITPFPHQ
jgi:hypothetical protein